LTVVGFSSRVKKTTDTYSLAGFTKTKNLIDKTCKSAGSGHFGRAPA
jgi:hypothetical protein